MWQRYRGSPWLTEESGNAQDKSATAHPNSPQPRIANEKGNFVCPDSSQITRLFWAADKLQSSLLIHFSACSCPIDTWKLEFQLHIRNIKTVNIGAPTAPNGILAASIEECCLDPSLTPSVASAHQLLVPPNEPDTELAIQAVTYRRSKTIKKSHAGNV